MSGERKSQQPRIGVRIIKAAERLITKAESPVQLDKEQVNNGEWLSHPCNLHGLSIMTDESTILPQCIRAYRNNIAGFGISIEYLDEYKAVKETSEMKAEWDKLKEVLDLLNTDKDTKEVFEDVVESRETFGCAYLEVVRNLAREVVQVEVINDTPSIYKTRHLDPFVEVTYYYKNAAVTRKKRFRKYKQVIGGRTIYYKEFGDPRVMDMRSGDYVDTLEIQYQANEILEFAIGTEAYGKVRWIGQTLTVDGARRAEQLNNN